MTSTPPALNIDPVFNSKKTVVLQICATVAIALVLLAIGAVIFAIGIMTPPKPRQGFDPATDPNFISLIAISVFCGFSLIAAFFLLRSSRRVTLAVDFLIVGSGAAGGVLARELSRAGFAVVLMEQGRRMRPQDFEHDELKYWLASAITNDSVASPQSFRDSPLCFPSLDHFSTPSGFCRSRGLAVMQVSPATLRPCRFPTMHLAPAIRHRWLRARPLSATTPGAASG